MSIYPDWPQTDDDLVPLPCVEGPKLKAFDFGGPQQIEFLEYIGKGLHGHVIKVRILSQEYALKVFRFGYTLTWPMMQFSYLHEREHTKELSHLAPYLEPFYNECRAYGRLSETGHEDLSVRCFGYVLLDEEHERALRERFPFELDGDDLTNDDEFLDAAFFEEDYNVRAFHVGPSGRPPPLRAIVKAFDCSDSREENFSKADARGMFHSILELHQLGVFSLDVRRDQFTNRKLYDFSMAATIPHLLTTPALLHPDLSPETLKALEFELFCRCAADYWNFEIMVAESNESREQKKKLKLFYVHGREGYPRRGQPRPRTFVDPRQIDWTKKKSALNKFSGSGKEKRAAGRVIKIQRGSLRARDRRSWWYLDVPPDVSKYLRRSFSCPSIVAWGVRDSYIVPVRQDWFHCFQKMNTMLASGGNFDKHQDIVEADKKARFIQVDYTDDLREEIREPGHNDDMRAGYVKQPLRWDVSLMAYVPFK